MQERAITVLTVTDESVVQSSLLICCSRDVLIQAVYFHGINDSNVSCNYLQCLNIIGTACIVSGAGSVKGVVSVHLSVPAWAHSCKPTAAGLLL